MMSGLGAELSKGAAPKRPHHQLHRSVSEMPIVPKTKGVHHHHYAHLHRRDKDEKGERSAGSSLLPSKTLDGTKSEGVTPNASRSGSRRASVFSSPDDNLGGLVRERRIANDGVVKAEKEKNVLRANELRKSLTELNTFSNDTTRRLDNTYYSILEKLSALHNIIESLKELAATSRRLNDEFEHESKEIVRDIGLQLDGFNDFHDQEQKITDLEYRIEIGRGKSQFLGDRVEVVRQKIDRWERVEGEWQERTRKRLKILWVVMAIIILVVVGLVIFQYTPARSQRILQGLNASNGSINLQELEERFGNETLRLKRSVSDALESLKRVPEEPLEEDPRLKAFDEL